MIACRWVLLRLFLETHEAVYALLHLIFAELDFDGGPTAIGELDNRIHLKAVVIAIVTERRVRCLGAVTSNTVLTYCRGTRRAAATERCALAGQPPRQMASANTSTLVSTCFSLKRPSKKPIQRDSAI